MQCHVHLDVPTDRYRLMIGKVTAAPIRIGVLGAARIADLAIVRPARVTGHRLVAVAARDRRRAEDFARRHGVERALGTYADVLATRTEALGPWSSYTYQLEAFAGHLRNGAPLLTGADDTVASLQLIDDCYRAACLPPRPAGQPLI